MVNESGNGNSLEWWKKHSPTMDYDSLDKVGAMRPIFQRWDSEGKLGRVILDVGSGPIPLSRSLVPRNQNRKTILIDIADITITNGHCFIKADVSKVVEPNSFTTKKAVVTASEYLKTDPRSVEGGVDTIILSEILNYVDYRAVVEGLSRYLRPGGRMIVLNLPGRHPVGQIQLLHDKGVKSNLELIKYLESGFEIEETFFPFGREEDVGNTPGEDVSMVLLIARRK